ncbi:hypothetical protein ACPV36_20045, partial [Photobacterium damselae]|uniref:hypothetical protein n=1 Tax=Photobacterium damselae TaxID=38293 RepID=UPI0040688B52
TAQLLSIFISKAYNEKKPDSFESGFLNKWRSGRDCYTENQRAPGVTGRLALKQKANQLNYRSTFIYLLFIKHVTKKSLTLSNQAFLNKWRSGRDSNPRPPA